MQIVSRSNTGLVRQNNEDSILIKEPCLFAVADGMGGHRAGEVASAELVELLAGLELAEVPEDRILTSIEEKINEINAAIWLKSGSGKEYEGMATTVSMVYVPENSDLAYVGHVGDSRIYLLQADGLKQLTSDHSYVAEMVRRKQLSPEEAEASDMKHLITRAVGADSTVEVDTFAFLTTGARRLLLCTDGLYNMVPPGIMESMLGEEDLEMAAEKLLSSALEAGGKDNISFIILELEK